jgi:uncharacterized protein YdhG (YjbR/CyaY superfamily)
VDAYIAGFPDEVRPVLEELRALVRAGAPEATERISYGIPTFDLKGKYFLYFAGWKHHVSLYPVSEAVERALGQEIEPFRGGKGTLKFPLGTPLPVPLIRRVVAARAAEVMVPDA